MKDSTRTGLAITAGAITGLSLLTIAAYIFSSASSYIGEKIIDVSFGVGKAILKKGKTEETVED